MADLKKKGEMARKMKKLPVRDDSMRNLPVRDEGQRATGKDHIDTVGKKNNSSSKMP